jgi:hypothetical protein
MPARWERTFKEQDLDLEVPITLTDELTEDVISARGLLDLSSGEIRRVVYDDYDVQAQGLPAQRSDYEFTSGTLSHDGRDLEFRVDVHPITGRYSVSVNELLEIKKRAAALFAGGKTAG